MYNLDISLIGERLKQYRKQQNLTLEQMGKEINKSKATVAKYEKGEIVPDIITILEICNTLDISLSQIFPIPNTSNNRNNFSSTNPFSSDIIYLYYYTENKLILSIMEIQIENSSTLIKLYNGVKDPKHYKANYCYYYEGTLESDNTIGYIKLYNDISRENVQILFILPWSKNFQITNFFILGLTPNYLPIVKKGIMSSFPIKNLNSFKKNLLLSKSDLLNIQKDNGWILSNTNFDLSYLF